MTSIDGRRLRHSDMFCSIMRYIRPGKAQENSYP